MMSKRAVYLLAAGLIGLVTVGFSAFRYAQPRVLADDRPTDNAVAPLDRPADREAIARRGQEFREAFAKGDTRAITALYTEQAEYYDDSSGETFRGRPEIEKAYAAFFKEHPGRKIVVQSKSLRFLGRDTAVWEGLVRLEPVEGEMPTSTRFSCFLVREDGQWKLALEHEWGVTENKLEDLAWLIGDWTNQTADRELRMNFRWNDKKTLIVEKFTLKEAGRDLYSGTQRIGVDPETGQIRSWMVNQQAGRRQSVWVRDGKNWLLDSVGTLAGGMETTSVNIISRINNDAFTWRSVDRRIGPDELPPTDPIKLVRAK